MIGEPRRIAWQISLFYAALFVGPGIWLPFWSVWLESRGLGATEIAIVVSGGIWLRLVAGPVAAHLVDRSGARRRAIILLAWGCLLTFLPLWWAHSFWPLFLIAMLYAVMWAPITPFSENVALLAARRYDLQYGRMRLWGSISFLVTAYVAGLWLKGRDDDWIWGLILAAMALLALASHLLPDLRLPLDRPRLTGAPALRLLRHPVFRTFLAASACLQSTHAMLYTFGTLQWRSVGLGDAQIGWLWAEGVLAEVVLFAVGQQVLRHTGGIGLLLLASAGGLLRWSLTGITGDFTLLVVLNLLHAATFGCAHLGAMRLLSEHVEPNVSATAQSLYTAANSTFLALATLAVGPLYAVAGGLAYWAMLPLSLAGGLFALLLWRRRDALQFHPVAD
ncbi:MFS transporter [Ferrovibrio xuzhouensis]|uniref:MFS transporter n=1 Tax=Ferrovibrio xuzhouensis TaxID=1576914 RepID=A0ABV7VFN4_9PROT